MGQPPDFVQSQAQNQDQPDENGARRFLQTQINKASQPDGLAAKVWAMSPANQQTDLPGGGLKQEGWGQGHRARQNNPEEAAVNLNYQQGAKPGPESLPTKAVPENVVKQEQAVAKDEKPQKRSLNALVKGMQPAARETRNKEMNVPNVIAPLAEATQISAPTPTPAPMAEPMLKAAVEPMQPPRPLELKPQELQPPPQPVQVQQIQYHPTEVKPVALKQEVPHQQANTPQAAPQNPFEALGLVNKQEPVKDPYSIQAPLPPQLLGAPQLQIPQSGRYDLNLNQPATESRAFQMQPVVEKQELIKPAEPPPAAFQIDNEAFEAPNCVQTMRIDTMSGVKTITTMLPDSSSTRIESCRSDGSKTVTFTENLRSTTTIQARPMIVRESNANGYLISETRYQYHNAAEPCIPTGKRMVIGDQVIDYTLDSAGQIIDQKLVPKNQV